MHGVLLSKQAAPFKLPESRLIRRGWESNPNLVPVIESLVPLAVLKTAEHRALSLSEALLYAITSHFLELLIFRTLS